MSFLVNGKDSSGFDFDAIVPRVKVKFRDKLVFRGMRCDYSDLCRFAYIDGKYIPLMFYNGHQLENAKILDLLPAVCVGLAETLALPACEDSPVLLDFYQSIMDDLKTKPAHSLALALALSRLDFVKNERGASMMCALRSGFRHQAFAHTGTIARTLYVLSFLDQELFAKVLFDGMRYVYSYHSFWTSDASNTLVGIFGEGDEISDVKDQIFPPEAHNMKCFEYDVPGSDRKRRITNGRGFSIGAFLTLLTYLYKYFGESLNKNTLNLAEHFEENADYLSQAMNSSLGDDWVGITLRGSERDVDCFGSGTLHLAHMEIFGTAGSEMYKVDGNEYCRDVYENAVLFSKSLGLDKVITPTAAPYMGYAYPGGLQETLMGFICSAPKDELFSFVFGDDTASHEGETEESADDSQELKDLRTECGSLRCQLVSMKDKYISETESLHEEIGSVKYALSQKEELIDKLYKRIESLQGEFGKVFSDDDFVEPVVEEEEEVDLDSMIDYINSFKFLIVGGRTNLVTSLDKLGFTNLVRVESPSDLDGSTADVDFICVNTQFCSHKTCFRVRKCYSGIKDALFYYNGVNAEGLIRSCYEFVKRYIGG